MSHRFLPITAVLLLASCGEKNSYAPPPPTPVGVVEPTVRRQQTYSEFTGRIEALQVVEVRARVKGILEKVGDGFAPGMRVKAGTPLFQIEVAPYLAIRDASRAALEMATANLAIAMTTLSLAETTLEKLENAGEGVPRIQVESAKIDVEAAKAEIEAAKARIDAARADLDIAELDVGYCTIEAPVSGRISELLVDQFNLVGSGEPTVLCTIVNDARMHVYFDADERRALQFLRHRKHYEDTGRTPPKADLFLADGTRYAHRAQLELADNRLDSTTGTLRVRGVVDNGDGVLADGLFVRVKVPDPGPDPDVTEPPERILVPDTAIQQDLAGYYVLTVGDGDAVVRKTIDKGQLVVDPDAPATPLRIVVSGLNGDEQIIVEGLQRIREGSRVAPRAAASANPGPPAEPAPEPANPAGN